MNTMPSNDPAQEPAGEPHAAYDPPSSDEITAILLNFLRGYWNAPRHKAKWTEGATVLLTLAIAIAAIWSGWVFQAQLDIMRDADRPWIDMDIQITSPLTFDGKTVRTEFTFIPSNIGRSPAQNISIIPILTPAFLGDNLREIQERMCGDTAFKYGMGSLKYVLFQGHHYSQPVGLEIPVQDLDSLWGKLPPGIAPPDPIGIALVGCVDYTYESSAHHHQTAFAYDLAMKDGGLPLKSRTPIAPSDLILRAHPVDSHFPN
jgi:hypothetical protein